MRNGCCRRHERDQPFSAVINSNEGSLLAHHLDLAKTGTRQHTGSPFLKTTAKCREVSCFKSVVWLLRYPKGERDARRVAAPRLSHPSGRTTQIVHNMQLLSLLLPTVHRVSGATCPATTPCTELPEYHPTTHAVGMDEIRWKKEQRSEPPRSRPHLPTVLHDDAGCS